MRRYITVTVCTMIMLAALGMIFLMRNKFPKGNSFYITVNSQDGSSEMILPFDTEDDCAVFVLPAYAKIEEATFTSDGMDIVGSDGTILVSSGMKCTSVSVNCKYELTVPNDANRTVLFLQSDGVAAMYIDTSEEELEKENQTNGIKHLPILLFIRIPEIWHIGREEFRCGRTKPVFPLAQGRE